MHAFMHIRFDSCSKTTPLPSLLEEWVRILNYTSKTTQCTQFNTVIHRTLQLNIAYTIYEHILMFHTNINYTTKETQK